MYVPYATGFDGVNDYFTRGADLNGNAVGKTGIFSAWIRIDGGDGGLRRILELASLGFNARRTTANKFRLTAKNAAGTKLLSLESINAHSVNNSHLHLLSSWDVANDEAYLYINDVDEKNLLRVIVDDNIVYTSSDHFIAAKLNATQNWFGAIAELYFAPNQFLQFSTVSNRRLFIDSAGNPVDLGPSGYKPTGVAPLIYMCTQFNNYGKNCGTGGDFTDQGSVSHTVGPVAIPKSPSRGSSRGSMSGMAT